MSLAVQVVGIIAVAMLLTGCVLLHLRLRAPSSLSFLLAIAAIAVWSIWGQAALGNALFAPTNSNGNSALDLVALGRSQVITAAVDGILMLWFCISFLMAVISIPPRNRA